MNQSDTDAITNALKEQQELTSREVAKLMRWNTPQGSAARMRRFAEENPGIARFELREIKKETRRAYLVSLI